MKMELDSQSAIELKPLTLWLVDDNAACRQLLADMFVQSEAMYGIYCERQFDSAEAMLEALRVEPTPDVILSDVQMPGRSGVDSVVPIKRLAPHVQVVLLTTFYDSDAALRARRDGAAAFLLKSYPFAHIAAFVRDPHAARRTFQVDRVEMPTNTTPVSVASGSERVSRIPNRMWHWWEAGRTLLRVFLRSRTPASPWPKS